MGVRCLTSTVLQLIFDIRCADWLWHFTPSLDWRVKPSTHIILLLAIRRHSRWCYYWPPGRRWPLVNLETLGYQTPRYITEFEPVCSHLYVKSTLPQNIGWSSVHLTLHTCSHSEHDDQSVFFARRWFSRDFSRLILNRCISCGQTNLHCCTFVRLRLKFKKVPLHYLTLCIDGVETVHCC